MNDLDPQDDIPAELSTNDIPTFPFPTVPRTFNSVIISNLAVNMYVCMCEFMYELTYMYVYMYGYSFFFTVQHKFTWKASR